LPADEESPELARFLKDFAAVCPEPSIDHCEAAHLNAIFASAQHLADPGHPTPGQVGETPKLTSRSSGLGTERGNWMARRSPKWLGIKLVIPLAILLFAFGGVALAGGLVYHQASEAGDSPVITQPGPGDGALAPIDVDDVDHQAAEVDDRAVYQDDQADQGDVDKPDVDGSDDSAIEEKDGDELGLDDDENRAQADDDHSEDRETDGNEVDSD
jgi:hypothetical protein